MKEIPINLSGIGGLAPNFAGDKNKVSSQPHLRIAGDGQMVEGLFNPYLVDGYLAPTTTTTTNLTVASTKLIGSSLYDNVKNEYYLGERGEKIFKGSGLSDQSPNEIISLDAGAVINDLEIYELNGSRKLFYTYQKDAETISLTTRANVASDLYSLGIQLKGANNSSPSVVFSDSVFVGYNPYSYTIEIPNKDNVAVVVIAGGKSADLSSVSINSVAFTKDFEETVRSADTYPVSEDFEGASGDYTYAVWSLYEPTHGSQVLSITPSGGSLQNYIIIVIENANADVVGSVVSNYLLSNSVTVNPLHDANSAYLQYTSGINSLWTLNGSLFLENYEDIDAKFAGSEVATGGFAFKNDGTKFYASSFDSGVAKIYEFNLSNNWNLPVMSSSIGSINLHATGISNIIGINFSSDGTKVYFQGNVATKNIEQFTLTTPWSITTAGSRVTKTFTSLPGDIANFTFNSSGTKIYALVVLLNERPRYFIYEFNLSTAWDISSASIGERIAIPKNVEPTTSSLGIALGNNDRVLYFKGFTSPLRAAIFQKDKSLLNLIFTSDSTSVSTSGGYDIFFHPDGKYWYKININVPRKIQRFTMPEGAVPSFTSQDTILQEELGSVSSSQLATLSSGFGALIDIGHESIPSGISETSWLSGVKNETITSSSGYNFLRKADNGFMYFFTKNSVHKIDGGRTGGADGAFTRDVLTFPSYFTISDAVDYRSNLYIAVNKSSLDLSAVNRGNYSDTCFVYVWDRNSVQLSSASIIEVTGVREIKKIYPGSDGHLRLIVINDTGLSELRRFGYNDSGSAVFSETVSLGLGGHPQYPDGASVVAEKNVWLANNGKMFCERNMAVNQIFQAEEPTSSPSSTILSGAVLFGTGVETASGDNRDDKQGILYFYNTASGPTVKRKVYPFDFTTGSNGNQTPHPGNVYTGVTYLPVTSLIRRIRIYNAPVTSTGDTVIATVKIYFNQSPTVSMTKSVTLNEAKRGYVDFNISKSYVHAVQIEVEWSTGTPIGPDMYLPSVAIISTEETGVATPDSE